MSLSQALAAAVSGLRVSQAGLATVAANVANAETPGYVRKVATPVTTATSEFGGGVRIDAVNRQLDQFVQRQLRVESAGASYADLRAQFYQRLQGIYGAPGSDSALETVFNKFIAALQGLSTSPESPASRSAVLSSAQVLAQQLNGMSADIQGLRSDAELGLADAVARANKAMKTIADVNQKLGGITRQDAAAASLLDARDQAIDELSQLMDIKVVASDGNQVGVFTNSGIQLVGRAASTLSFDAQGTVTPTARWDADPSQRTVGTISLVGPNGDSVDLMASRAIRSGQIAAYIEMRDQVLVQAQAQLDGIAAAMASALSDKTVAGTPATVGAQSGFDIDLAGLQNGNSVRIAYTDNTTNTQRTITLVRVDDPAALPLSNAATADPNDKVVGLDFSGGMASVLGQLSNALGNVPLQFSNPSGTTLRILDDGAFNRLDVNAVSATNTVTTLTGGSAEFPFFLDGSVPYTGAITSVGPQAVGLSGRLAVNPALLADPSRLVVYQTSPLTPSGDATRPNFIYSRLNDAALTFSPQTGIGSAVAPYSGPLPTFLRQLISQQGDAAQAADGLKQGQDVVFNALQQRMSDTAGVSIDEEMSNLLNLQNSYAASARVLGAVKDMMDALLKM